MSILAGFWGFEPQYHWKGRSCSKFPFTSLSGGPVYSKFSMTSLSDCMLPWKPSLLILICILTQLHIQSRTILKACDMLNNCLLQNRKLMRVLVLWLIVLYALDIWPTLIWPTCTTDYTCTCIGSTAKSKAPKYVRVPIHKSIVDNDVLYALEMCPTSTQPNCITDHCCTCIKSVVKSKTPKFIQVLIYKLYALEM